MEFVTVAAGVLVRTSRREHTTTTLVLGRRVGPRRAALLVDPAWEADELESLAAEVDVRGSRVVAGFSTHAHVDHLLWHPALGDVPRWATPTAAAVAAADHDRLRAELREDALRHDGVVPPAMEAVFGRVAPIAGPDAGVPDPEGLLPPTEVVSHDAHAPGHGALWLPEVRVLVVGDMLSDRELPLVFDEITGSTDVVGYLAGLERLTPVVARADALVPGHGTPSRSPLERLDADRRYLDAVLAGSPVDDPRLSGPGMAAEHERLCRVVAGEEPA
ncbi:MBL fold metallo-hydrolase [Isoptericola sp. NEAU-Y5]|uniref:MBL fold metallo-hydrolase n=1 Tax=Isoptericola luteus TaxID=2879484 RepID=A0ABS7ZI60_9MICO|nr:MBL fold metallo-hydrolase [Isoptericola sp. NEAU-Y5]MCA5893509.1 MBL fold metallo-hydrolase [Isoptericola sp. NEAU-Y5]